MSEKFAQWLMSNRSVSILLSLIVVIGMTYGLRYADLTFDYRAYFSKDNPQKLAFDKMQVEYSKNDNIMIIIEPKTHDVFTPRILDLVEKITAKSWETPHSRRVDSITNFQHTQAHITDEGEEELIVENLFENSLNLPAEEIRNKKDTALNEPLLVNSLVSSSGDVTAVNITISLPEANPKKELPEAVSSVRQMVADFKLDYPEVNFYLTGISMLNNAFPEASLTDSMTLYPAVFLIILVLLVLILRSFWGTAVTLLIVIMSGIAGVGFISWPGREFTPIETAAPIMIMTLAIADCVHLLISYFYQLGLNGNRKSAMLESLKINIQPVFLTSITTAIGFLSLNFSDSPPFRELGNTVAVGVMVALLLSFFFLPAVMTLLPIRARKKPVYDPNKFIQFADFTIRKRKPILISTGIFIIGLIALIPLNEISDVPVNFFAKSIQFRQDADFMDERLTGINTIQYSIAADGEMGISDPYYLAKLDEFANWLREQPNVVQVTVFSDIMKRLNKNMNNDDEDFYQIPESRPLAAQYLLLYEISLPVGLDLTNQINMDKSATRIIIRLKKITSKELIKIDQAAKEWLQKNTKEDMWAEGASTDIMFAYITKRNVISMLKGLCIGIALISITLIFALRSFQLGVLSLLPNLVPAAMAFGIWGIFDGKIGLGLSVVSGMTLGIVVDDSVHFLSKYLRGIREHKLDSIEAIKYAYKTVGFALVTTTIILSVGFFVLILSDFTINSNMGIVTAITIVLALFVDLLFLPPLLATMSKKLKV